jgi:tetratricopeptide (TPR) repeat protein
MKFDQNDSDYLKGMEYFLSGDWIEAEKIFNELIKKYQDSTYMLLILGDIYYSLGRLDEAVITYQKTLNINPEYCISYYKMGISAYRSGKLDEALKYFKKVDEIKCNNDTMANYYIGLINFFQGNDNEAIANFEILKKESYESKIANYYLAQLKLKKNEFKEAEALLEELLLISPKFLEIYHLLGEAYYKMHDLVKATRYIKKAIELNPNDKKAKEMLELLTTTA